MKINTVIFQPYHPACTVRSFFLCKTGRSRIQDLLVFTIPVISLIGISISNINWKIHIITGNQCLLITLLSSQYQCCFSICILSIIIGQTHLLPGWNKFIDPISGPSHKSDQYDQQTYYQDRHTFFRHFFFLSVQNTIKSFSL